MTVIRYEVRTAYNVPLQGQPEFASRAEAVHWAQGRAIEFPGIEVARIILSKDESVVWRDRPASEIAA